METTNLTIEDFEYIPSDTLADSKLLTTTELMAEWDASFPLPNGSSWANVRETNYETSEREKRRLGWIPGVLADPIVDNNRLAPHWDLAMELAAHRSGIGYIPQHSRVE